MLQEKLIEEIKAIPQEKIIDVYKIIHQFCINLATTQLEKSKTVDEVFGKLYKKGRNPVSVEEMNAAIKNRMKNKFK